jgi:hypothetical protein
MRQSDARTAVQVVKKNFAPRPRASLMKRNDGAKGPFITSAREAPRRSVDAVSRARAATVARDR